MISVVNRVENIVGKGENAGYQHFLLFPQWFQKASFLGVVKSLDCVVKSYKANVGRFGHRRFSHCGFAQQKVSS